VIQRYCRMTWQLCECEIGNEIVTQTILFEKNLENGLLTEEFFQVNLFNVWMYFPKLVCRRHGFLQRNAFRQLPEFVLNKKTESLQSSSRKFSGLRPDKCSSLLIKGKEREAGRKNSPCCSVICRSSEDFPLRSLDV
jgi:hypothetical protein